MPVLPSSAENQIYQSITAVAGRGGAAESAGRKLKLETNQTFGTKAKQSGLLVRAVVHTETKQVVVIYHGMGLRQPHLGGGVLLRRHEGRGLGQQRKEKLARVPRGLREGAQAGLDLPDRRSRELERFPLNKGIRTEFYYYIVPKVKIFQDGTR